MVNSNPGSRDGGEEEKTRADAYIYFRTLVEGGFVWHAIKEESSSKSLEEAKRLYPVFVSPPKHQLLSSCAALGSTIYVLGGTDMGEVRHNSFPQMFDDVYYINTLRPIDGWKKGPSMKNPRSLPMVTTAEDNKIYVMGWFFNSKSTPPCAEVYYHDHFSEDKVGCWRDLPNIPRMPLFGGAVFLDDGKKKRILVHTSHDRFIYSYDIECDSWETHSETSGERKCSSALVDGRFLYYLDNNHQGFLFGLDVSNPENLPKVVSGLEGDHYKWIPPGGLNELAPEAHLVSLGNSKLAVVWSAEFYGPSTDLEEDGLLDVVCSKLKMFTRENEVGEVVEFVAHPLSSSRYRVEGFSLFDCLAVFPSPDKTEEEESQYGDITLANNRRTLSRFPSPKRKRQYNAIKDCTPLVPETAVEEAVGPLQSRGWFILSSLSEEEIRQLYEDEDMWTW